MRVLLRDTVSSEYYAGRDLWDYEARRAFVFRTTYEAFLHASKVGSRKLEIVLSFEDPSFDMVIPVKSATDAAGVPLEIPVHAEVMRKPEKTFQPLINAKLR